MLQKVQNIEALFVTRVHYENPWILPFPFQVYENGARQVEGQVSLTGGSFITSLEKAGSNPEFLKLKVTTYPTIIFMDSDTGRIITRLENLAITENNVASALLYIDNLSRDGDGNYFNASGEKVLFSGPGLGFFNLNIPRIAWLLPMAICGYQALKREGTPALLFGGVSVYSLTQYLKK